MFHSSFLKIPAGRKKCWSGYAMACLCLCLAFGLSSETLLAAGSRGGCPPLADHNPQPTPVPKPDTQFIASPNFNARDAFTAVDSVVMHTTEVNLSGTIDIFLDRGASVSSHFVVAPNGDIYEMVDTRNRAWHATYYNSRSIGIEMVGYANQPSTWNDDNLGALVDLLAWIVTAYPEIPLVKPTGDAYDDPGDRYRESGLVAHSQVQPWNKDDPGPYFPWESVINDVADTIAAAVPEPTALALCIVGLLFVPRRQR